VSAQVSNPRPSTNGALFKPLTSWVWDLRCWWNPPVRFRAAGFGFFGESVFGFVVRSSLSRMAKGEVPERHFGDTAADSAHRMADPGGHPQSTLGYGRSRAPGHPRVGCLDGRPVRQFAVAAAASGLMWANMLRPFQVGKARTSHDGPSSWIRESRVASPQESCPACHLTNASASAVM
jgi:hypothetical protein